MVNGPTLRPTPDLMPKPKPGTCSHVACAVRRQNRRMTHPGELSDLELVRRAQQWRRQSLHGARHAGNHARAHEAEIWVRFGGGTTLAAPLASRQKVQRPWWRLW